MNDINTIRKVIAEKIENKVFSSEDIENYFQVFCEIGRTTEEFQEEIENWDRKIVFDLEEAGIYWISTCKGEITSGKTNPDNSDLTLKMEIENVIKIFTGELDPGVALLTGKLRVKGELPDAIKFGELMEIVAEEIEND